MAVLLKVSLYLTEAVEQKSKRRGSEEGHACTEKKPIHARLTSTASTQAVEARAADWAAEWLTQVLAIGCSCGRAELNPELLSQELTKSPVLLISESNSATFKVAYSHYQGHPAPLASTLLRFCTEDAEKRLKEACVRFDILELDRLGSAGTALLEQLKCHNR